MKKTLPAVMCTLAALAAAGTLCRATAEPLVLAEGGAARAPVIVPADAPAETRRAAEDLARYLEKIAGARPPVLAGAPDPLPERAVWVGAQPALAMAWPALELEFTRPEEILLACDGRHLVIAGRDRFAGGQQVEFGTVNAVFTFLQDYLGVRWLWPGDLGEDVPRRDTVALEPFEHRFAPLFLQRALFRRPDRTLGAWLRGQRILDYTWRMDIGHAFDNWWERYHETNPEYFALQPDGTRSGFPSAHNAKLCEANPEVGDRWLVEVGEQLAADPARVVFNAAPNDGSNAGICICADCRAWDNLEAQPWRLSWRGLTQDYLSVTDRYVKFWNRLAVMLEARYPGRGLHVSGMAYGPAKPPPLAVELEQNIAIGYVGHFPIGGDESRAREKAEWAEWAKKAPKLIFRPNVFWYSGGWHGLPALALRNTIEDFRFLAEHSGIGVAPDTLPRHWATQGPQYYLMAQLAWDPFRDAEALLADYYARGFGPAAGEVRAYFELMEQAHMAIVNRPGWRHSMGAIREPLTEAILEAYRPALLAEAGRHLASAAAMIANGPEVFLARLSFVGAGLEFTELLLETMRAMGRVRETDGRDAASVQRALELCAARDALFARHGETAFHAYFFNNTFNRGRGLQDYLGPPSEAHRRAAGLE